MWVNSVCPNFGESLYFLSVSSSLYDLPVTNNFELSILADTYRRWCWDLPGSPKTQKFGGRSGFGISSTFVDLTTMNKLESTVRLKLRRPK